MRTDQFVGLPKNASEFTQLPNIVATPSKIRYIEGMFGDKYYLDDFVKISDAYAKRIQELKRKIYSLNEAIKTVKERAILEGEVIYREQEQSSKWSSGPVMFTKLVDEKGKTIAEHSQEKIDQA
ncbi:hypothetical protein KJ632_00830 [Patescibacteria group bacterium]|nr:hypothetical protein [Patescibacteria group bacterium]